MIVILCLLISSIFSAHSIVFFDTIPRMWDAMSLNNSRFYHFKGFFALKQARLFNPSCPIYFVSNPILESHICAVNKEIKNEFGGDPIKFISVSELNQVGSDYIDDAHNYFSSNAYCPWNSERFFYCKELMKRDSLENVFLIEWDNLIYSDFGQFSGMFEAYKNKIGLILIKEDGYAIPSCLFISNHHCFRPFLSTLLNRLNTDDMLNLQFFWTKTHRESLCETLPIVPSGFFSNRRINGIYANRFELFNSVFDGAALGQYLSGTYRYIPKGLTDPDDIGFINPDNCFDPRLFQYYWKRDGKGRKVPYLKFRNKSYVINNLHIHSKQLEKYYSLSP